MAILKGDDKILQFTLTNDDGSPIVISSLIGMVVWLYQNQTALGKYSINALSGYELIQVLDDANGIFQINFKRSKIASAPLQKISAEVKISETNTDFENNEQLTTIANIEIDLLQDSLTKDVIVFA